MRPSDFPARRPGRSTGAVLALAAALVTVAVRSDRSGLRTRPHRRIEEPGAERSLTLGGHRADELRPIWCDPEKLGRILARFARIEPEGSRATRWHTGQASWTMRLDDTSDEVVWIGEGDAPLRRLAVRFRDPVGQQGTVVTLALEVDAPGGPLGRMAARAFGDAAPSGIAISALHAFKALVETGEIPTTDHQPAARRDPR